MSSLQITFVFALALCAVVCAGVAWTTSSLLTRMRRMERRHDTLRIGFATLSQKLAKLSEESTPAMTLARLDDLAAAVDARFASQRKELGRIWQRVGKDSQETSETEDGYSDGYQQHALELARLAGVPGGLTKANGAG